MREGLMVLDQAGALGESFEAVFAAHRDYVYRLAYALLGDAQDAEDVTQEVFLRVYKALPTYRPERAGLRTWLAQIAVNACRTHRRRNFWRRRQAAAPPAGDADAALAALADPSPWGAPEGRALQAELRRTVQEVLTTLRPDQRTALVLHYYLDLSCPEIARIMGCSEGTVYSRLHYGRRRVQAQLEARQHREGS